LFLGEGHGKKRGADGAEIQLPVLPLRRRAARCGNSR
jgi:hypothetical protein